jgi:hypothetical protein
VDRQRPATGIESRNEAGKRSTTVIELAEGPAARPEIDGESSRWTGDKSSRTIVRALEKQHNRGRRNGNLTNGTPQLVLHIVLPAVPGSLCAGNTYVDASGYGERKDIRM